MYTVTRLSYMHSFRLNKIVPTIVELEPDQNPDILMYNDVQATLSMWLLNSFPLETDDGAVGTSPLPSFSLFDISAFSVLMR